MADCGVLTCDDKDITPEQIFRRVVRMGADGCPAISTKAVNALGPCSKFIKCLPDGFSQDISWEQLFLLMTSYNDNGCLSVPVVVTNAACQLGDLSAGQLHCTTDYLIVVNPFGDMAYTGYYYTYEWSTDNGASWTLFGGNGHEEIVSTLPGFPLTPYLFRITVFCNNVDLYNRVYYSGNFDGFPFKDFIQVKVNGVLTLLKHSLLGINYFCPTDTLEFIQPNTDFDVSVTGADTWNTPSKIYTPGTLPDGSYTAIFTDISGGIGNGCNGSKSFETQMLATPVISGLNEICFGTTTVLSIGTTFDNYVWSNGANTPTIVVSSSGTYWVRCWNNGSTCILQSADFIVTVKPALPALVITNAPTVCHPDWNNASLVVGEYFTLYVTPGFDSYDFGLGPQVDNFIFVNGGGIYDCTAYIDGCSVTLPILFGIIENNVQYTLEYLGGCHYVIHITDPEVTQASVTGQIEGDVSGLLSLFSNVLDIDVNIVGPDTAWGVVADCGVDSDGCLKRLYILQTCI